MSLENLSYDDKIEYLSVLSPVGRYKFQKKTGETITNFSAAFVEVRESQKQKEMGNIVVTLYEDEYTKKNCAKWIIPVQYIVSVSR